MSLPTYEETIEYTRKHRAEKGYVATVGRTRRCVHCSKSDDRHYIGQGGLTCVPDGKEKFETMAFPGELTCAGCAHCRRCVLLFGQLPEDQSCQFFPSRFLQVVKP